MKYYLALIIFLVFSLKESNAQTTKVSETITLETFDKKIFTGELMYITSDSIFINNEDGPLTFSKSELKYFHTGVFSSDFLGTTNSSVPYYVQSALPNGDGNHYYKNYYIFGNEFNFGLSDNFNFTTGFESATTFFNSGVQLPLIQLGAKYSISASEFLHIGLSSKFYFNNEGNALMVTIPITLGKKRTNLTFAPSYISSDGSKLVGIFSNFSLALTSRTRFVFDLIRIDGVSLLSPNFEFMFRRGFSLSLGGILTPDGAIPSLSFSIPFGRWKKKYNN